MKFKDKITKLLILRNNLAASIFIAAFLLFGLSLLFSAQKVFAVNVDSPRNEDKLCIPKHQDKSNNRWVTDAFEFKFISRVEIKVNYIETGNCKTPSSLSSKYIHLSGEIEFATFTKSSLYLKEFNNDVVYIGEKVGGRQSDESRIQTSHWGDVFETKADGKNWDTYVNRTTASIDKALFDSQYTLSVEEDAMNGLTECSSGEDYNLLLVNADNDDRGVRWGCGKSDRTNPREGSSSKSGTGASVLPKIINKENFNIVFKSTPDGTKLRSVFTEDDEFTFSWNEAEQKYITNRGNGDQSIDGINPEGIVALDNKTKLVQVKNKGKTFDVVVAGPNNSAKASGDSRSDGTTGENSLGLHCSKSWINPLTWFMCPLIDAAVELVESLDKAIIDTLTIDSNKYFNETTAEGAKFYEVWANIRNFAMAFIVIAALIMVIAQALSLSFVDAYTIRKVLPRLIIAVIGISLSWPLIKFSVDLSNDLGNVVRTVIQAPFGSLGGARVNGESLALGAGGLVALSLSLGVMGILSFAVTAALAVVIAFGVIILREILVILLAVLVPFAIACYVLPNTEKVWNIWRDWFFRSLLLFPLIMAFLTTGRVFAAVSSEQDGVLSGVIAFLAYFGPYFALPTAFRLAGGAVATIGGMVNDRSRGAFDRLKNFRGNKAKQNWQDTVAGNRFKGEGALSRRASHALQTGTLVGKAGLDPRKWRDRTRSARSALTSSLSAKAEESAEVQALRGNDDLLAASLHGSGTEQDARNYLRGLGQRGDELEQNVASITQARRAVGRDNFGDWAAANLAGTGTGYKSGPAEMLDTINRVAGGDRARAARILASARGQAERARRVDLYGAGFANSADTMTKLHRKQISATAANEILTDEALLTKSAGEVGTSRNNGFTNMTGAIQRRMANANYGVSIADSALKTARASGNANSIATAEATYKQALHEQKRVYAHTSSLLDVAGSTSPENAQGIGAIMGQPTGGVVAERYETRQARDINGDLAVDSTTNMPVMETVGVGARQETVGDVNERLRSDPEYQQYRREYGNAAQAAAAASMGGQQPGGPGGAQPGAGGPGQP